MTNKKLAARVCSVALAVVLCLGLSATAFAANGNGVTEASLTLDLQMDTNVTTPAATFSFEVSKVSLDGDETTEAKAAMPEIAINALKFETTDTGETPDSSNQKTVTKTVSNIVPAADQYGRAGIYTYHINERANTYTAQTGETMTYSAAEYQLVIYVKNDGNAADANKLSIRGVNVYVKDASGNYNTKSADGIKFVNQFKKNSGLTISKAVAGDMGDKTKQFSFNLNLTKQAALEPVGATYTGTITRATGSTETETEVVLGTDATFTLADGETLTFDNLPVGTTYTISEADYASEYAKTIDAISNSTAVNGYTDGGELVVGEGDNSVAYTNTKEGNVPTGIIVNNLPFILLILVALCGFAGYIVFKRKKYSN